MDALIERLLRKLHSGGSVSLCFPEAEMEANNYTFLKALFISGGGCSDRGYTYPRRFHRRLCFDEVFNRG